MSPEAQRIAIAEACGWRAEKWDSGGWMLYNPANDRVSDCGAGTREAAFGLYAPDYLTDLNAMHEVIDFMNKSQPDGWNDEDFLKMLCALTYGWPHRATAGQWAYAFLNVMGLWKSKEI